MIRNEDDLAVVRKQLILIEDALLSLRRDVLPKNKRNYEVFAEGYIDQIMALRAEIEEYLGLAPRPAAESPAGTAAPAVTDHVAPA